MPTLAPTTPQPSTAAPTCVGQILDVCIIVDESGSICTNENASPKLCNNGNCADVDPITGSTFCDGPSSSTCDYEAGCPRFNDIAGSDTPNVKNFTKRFIDEVEDQLANKGVVTTQYSVVEFATQAFITSGLTDNVTAKAAVNAIVYSGGFTNLQQGIVKCQETLADSLAQTKVMIVETDGFPNRRNDPAESGNTAARNAAEAAANVAKAADIQIATVYVLGGPSNGADFLKNRIASDTTLAFEDLSFPDAQELADAILDSVSDCFRD